MLTIWIHLMVFARAWALSPEEQLRAFDRLLAEHPEQVWVATISPRLKAAIHDYEGRAKLAGGASYGESVRSYSLKGKCAAEIEADMKKLGCARQEDVIREPRKNEPIRGKNGRTSPIFQYVCRDGGVVKVKPAGDPTNKFTPFPHASRVLRYPAEGPYRDYRDEVAKISQDGHVIPRGPGDLAAKNLVDGWSLDAHVPLKPCP